MSPLPVSVPPLFKGAKLSVIPLLYALSFLLFSDLWLRFLNMDPLLRWNFSKENIPFLFCHLIFMALPYAFFFLLVKPVLLFELRIITAPLFKKIPKSNIDVSEDWYRRYAAETNNSTALKALEDHKAVEDHTFWTAVLFSISLLLFVLDTTLCRHVEGAFVHLVLPPKVTPWIPLSGFLPIWDFSLTGAKMDGVSHRPECPLQKQFAKK